MLCEALGHPERSFTSLHVAGTNGKGSVTAMAHAALHAAGLRTARYTSPHLADITERFVIGETAVDTATFDEVARDLLDLADGLVQSGRLRASPTFFEATTAIAFELFRRAGTQVAVIEVGLGGRFDATNVITPVAGAITTIGFDHQQHLGHTLAEIAFEKAGIIKPGMPIVAGWLPPDAMDVVRRVAHERTASLFEAARDVEVNASSSDGAFEVALRTPDGDYGPLKLALRGEHQVHNAAVAVRLLEAARQRGVGITRRAIETGLTSAAWPARLERLQMDGGRQLLLDAAHNAEGAASLAEYLARWHPERPALVVGVMRDKDTAAIVEPLLPRVSSVVATAAPTPRALAARDLEERLQAIAARLPPAERPAISREDDPILAASRALERHEVVVIAGSIFLVGPVRERLISRAILR